MLLAVAVLRSASAATYESGVDEIATVAGKLEISPIDSRDPHRGNRIAVDGKTIFETSRYLSIRATYPDEPHTRLVLVESNTGAVDCPFFFVVLELEQDHVARLTDEFGNCDDLASSSFYKVGENPLFERGVWHVALATRLPEQVREKLRAQTKIIRSGGSIEVKRPKELPENLRGEVELYEYEDGKITQGGKPVSTSASDPEWEWRKKLEHAIPNPSERNALVKKYGSASAAYRAWLLNEASRKVRPEEFR
jgi:hypothetical protein